MQSRYKPPEQRRDEWMREMHYRQRNIVYPETAFNAARFWRNLSSRKYPFRVGQQVCFAILILIVIPPVLAVGLGTLAYFVREETSISDWIGLLPVLPLFAFYAIVFVRGFKAVFGDAPTLPDLPMSSRMRMIGAKYSGAERH